MGLPDPTPILSPVTIPYHIGSHTGSCAPDKVGFWFTKVATLLHSLYFVFKSILYTHVEFYDISFTPAWNLHC